MVKSDVVLGFSCGWSYDHYHTVKALCTHPTGFRKPDRVKVPLLPNVRGLLGGLWPVRVYLQPFQTIDPLFMVDRWFGLKLPELDDLCSSCSIGV